MTQFGGFPATGSFPIDGRMSTGVSPMSAAPPSATPTATLPGSAQATGARRMQAAAALQRCYKWLEQAITIGPQLAGLVPPLLTAVQLYEAEQFDASLAQTMAVAQIAQQLLGSLPMLPPL
jgi:hypothetical protein